MILLVAIGTLFLLLAIGTPVGFSMGVAGALGLVLQAGDAQTLMGILQTAPLSAVSGYELMTIPMFLLMAEFVLLSGISDDLFKAMAAWVGRIPGGLGMATALAGAGFGAICGTSTASAATLSTTSLPAMLRQGYEPKMAAGVVAVSGTLAMLIPPSVALVIYGILAEVNIGALLVGGILPGIVVTLAIMLTVWILVARDPSRAPLAPRIAWRERIALLRVVSPMLILMGLVTGVIYTGVATPTEASALGAMGGLVIAIWKRKVTLPTLYATLVKAARGSCMIGMILLGASIFTYFFVITHVSQDLIAWVSGLDANRYVVIALLLLGYVVLGSFMDQIAILVLTIPVVVPLVKSLGFDLVWFGVLKIVTAEVGMITPPIGLNCAVVARYAKRPLGEVFRGTFPHFVAHLVVIALMVMFPDIILLLPNHMGHGR